jgi:hypothetical protein
VTPEQIDCCRRIGRDEENNVSTIGLAELDALCEQASRAALTEEALVKAQERVAQLKQQLRDAQNQLVMFDAAQGSWVGKKPLTMKQMNVLIRFINEFIPSVSRERRNTMKAIVVELQDTIDPLVGRCKPARSF